MWWVLLWVCFFFFLWVLGFSVVIFGFFCLFSEILHVCVCVKSNFLSKATNISYKAF